MSTHIEAKKGEIADAVLLPGDPMRAKWIAENFLDNPVLYNDVRGMLGYTGTYNGRAVSVQGTGMGVPSALIYCHELINEYGVTANFDLLKKAMLYADQNDINIKAGNVLTSDEFYEDNPDSYKHWAAYGVLAVEMETAGLYTIAAKFNVKALSILTISDSLVTGERTSADDREQSFSEMIELALGTIV